MKNKSNYLIFNFIKCIALSVITGCTDSELNIMGEPLILPTIYGHFVFVESTSADYSMSIEFAPGKEFTVEYGIYWSNINKIPSDSDRMEQGFANSSGRYYFHLYGLTPGMTYYGRCYVRVSGNIKYGEVKTFTTLGNVTSEIHFNPDLNYGTLADIDGNIYKTILIGSQLWMAENLKTTKYNDGVDIPQVIQQTEWNNLTVPGFCYYLNDPDTYKNTYGALYNYYTMNTGKLCPDGWHVPSDNEWSVLTSFLGGDSVSGAKLMETDTIHWVYSSSHITNSSGFTALPGGWRFPSGDFSEMGYEGYFWSSTAYYDPIADFYGVWMRNFYSNSEAIGRGYNHKSIGYSIRCVKD